MWVNKTQFISIFLMSFLGLFLFAGMNAEAEKGQRRLPRHTMKRPIWEISGSMDGFFPKRISDLVRKIKGVNKADRRLFTSGRAVFPGDTVDEDPFLFVNFVEENTVSKVQDSGWGAI